MPQFFETFRGTGNHFNLIVPEVPHRIGLFTFDEGTGKAHRVNDSTNEPTTHRKVWMATPQYLEGVDVRFHGVIITDGQQWGVSTDKVHLRELGKVQNWHDKPGVCTELLLSPADAIELKKLLRRLADGINT